MSTQGVMLNPVNPIDAEVSALIARACKQIENAKQAEEAQKAQKMAELQAQANKQHRWDTVKETASFALGIGGMLYFRPQLLDAAFSFVTEKWFPQVGKALLSTGLGYTVDKLFSSVPTAKQMMLEASSFYLAPTLAVSKKTQHLIQKFWDGVVGKEASPYIVYPCSIAFCFYFRPDTLVTEWAAQQAQTYGPVVYSIGALSVWVMPEVAKACHFSGKIIHDMNECMQKVAAPVGDFYDSLYGKQSEEIIDKKPIGEALWDIKNGVQNTVSWLWNKAKQPLVSEVIAEEKTVVQSKRYT